MASFPGQEQIGFAEALNEQAFQTLSFLLSEGWKVMQIPSQQQFAPGTPAGDLEQRLRDVIVAQNHTITVLRDELNAIRPRHGDAMVSGCAPDCCSEAKPAPTSKREIALLELVSSLASRIEKQHQILAARAERSATIKEGVYGTHV